jgi:hypothetical protein
MGMGERVVSPCCDPPEQADGLGRKPCVNYREQSR